jgi:hypothetical protein
MPGKIIAYHNPGEPARFVNMPAELDVLRLIEAAGCNFIVVII